MPAIPHIENVHTERVKFDPGDRVLVRAVDDMPPSNAFKIRRSIEKFSGAELRILIVNCLDYRMRRIGVDDEELLCGKEHAQMPSTVSGVANISLRKVIFVPGDKLFIRSFRNTSLAVQKSTLDYIKMWAGKDVEILAKWGDS